MVLCCFRSTKFPQNDPDSVLIPGIFCFYKGAIFKVVIIQRSIRYSIQMSKSAADIQLQTYRCRHTAANIPLQTYRCKHTAANIIVDLMLT